MSKLVEKYLSVVKSLFPETSSGPSVGIDIGIHSCKMVELQYNQGAYELLDWAIEPIEEGDKEGTIKKIISRLKVPTKSFFTSVFGKGTLIRFIDLPKMNLEDLKKSFMLEADKYFPFPRDQIYMDCCILDPNADEKKMSVLVAAAKKNIIDDRINLLNRLGLQADFIGINAIALANTFNVLEAGRTKKADDSASSGESSGVAILDMGDIVSNLIIMVDNLPRFTRDIFFGGRHFSQGISNAMGISIHEAEKIKYQPSDKVGAILNACDSVVMSLVSELRLSFDYFVTEKNTRIEKVVLTGGGSLLKGIESALSKHLDLTVEMWDPLESLTIADSVEKDAIEQHANQLGVSLGLALYH